MSDTPTVVFNSGTTIRSGYMGFVINMATKIKKIATENKLTTIDGSEDVFSEKWNSFLSGEFERSTQQNERQLGGRGAQVVEEDEETNFDVNMDKIMQRFKCFNQVIATNNSEDDDSSKDDTATEDDTDASDSYKEQPRIEVTLPTPETIDSTYTDAGYWKVEGLDEDIDDLLADYE
jgi:hypothetical protein